MAIARRAAAVTARPLPSLPPRRLAGKRLARKLPKRKAESQQRKPATT